MTDSTRRRGGRSNSLNALKNGVYSPQLRGLQRKDLRSLHEGGLEHEIALLRVLMRRAMQSSENVGDLTEAVGLLGALGLAATRLSILLRAQQALQSEKSSLSEDLSEIFEEARKLIKD